MAEVKITISSNLLQILENLAAIHQTTVGEVLDDALRQVTLAELEARAASPMIGMFDSGFEDTSERVEEILYGKPEPD
jgi:hypothetical protein